MATNRPSLSLDCAFCSGCCLICLLLFAAKLACFSDPFCLGFLLHLTLLTTSCGHCCPLLLPCLFLPLWIFVSRFTSMITYIVIVCMSASPSHFELSEHGNPCLRCPPPPPHHLNLAGHQVRSSYSGNGV